MPRASGPTVEWSCSKPEMELEGLMTLMDWNGKDLPLALRDLPPGSYVIQPASILEPSDAEVSDLVAALEDLDRNGGLDHDEVMARARAASQS